MESMNVNNVINYVFRIISVLLIILYYVVEAIILALIPKKLMCKDIRGETVLITGAGNGIGRLLALRFAVRGARLVLWDIDPTGNEQTAREVRKIGGEVFTYSCDISDRRAVYATAARVKEEAGKVTILVNNAGIVTGRRFLDCTDENIAKTFNINIMSHFWTLKAFLPDMIEANHGHLVSMASMAGLCGVSKLTDYCSSKFACVGLEESLRMELNSEGHTGVHSTVVCPFFVKTGMFNGVSAGILGFMEPEYVADQIMMAIMTNQEILILPKIFAFLIGFKGIVPTKVLYAICEYLGTNKSMKKFQGRTKQG